jgi:hypothetical protein
MDMDMVARGTSALPLAYSAPPLQVGKVRKIRAESQRGPEAYPTLLVEHFTRGGIKMA